MVIPLPSPTTTAGAISRATLRAGPVFARCGVIRRSFGMPNLAPHALLRAKAGSGAAAYETATDPWGGRVTIARRTASGIVISGGRRTAPAAVTVAGAVRGRSTFLVVGLQGGQCDGEDDVFDQGAAREVVDRLGQALQHWPYAQAVGVALDGLVGGVAG